MIQNNFDYDGFPIDDFAPAKGEGVEIHRVKAWQERVGVALCGTEVLHLLAQESKKGERRCKTCTHKLRKLRNARALAHMYSDDPDPTLTPHSKRGFRTGLYAIKSRQGARHTRGGNSHF